MAFDQLPPFLTKNPNAKHQYHPRAHSRRPRPHHPNDGRRRNHHHTRNPIMHKSIEVTIDPEGIVTIEATGFRGNACGNATKEIEEALGLQKSHKKKPEYYSLTTTTQQQVKV